MTLFRTTRALAMLLLAGVFVAGRCGAEEPPVSASPAGTGTPIATAAGDAAGIEFFEKKVRPLLAARCFECHGSEQQKGGLRLDSRAGVMTGGDTGAAVVAGKPDESLLVDAIRYGETYQMPPKSRLPDEEVATLVEWVRMGLPWGAEAAPAASSATLKAFDLQGRAQHWSFQPLSDVAPPAVANESWVRTPIDRFILAKLDEAKLTPAAPADKRTLLRRVTFDLTGLPPTPAEVAAFLADDEDGAYQRVVERLLASPRYGERWARHWLDLVRYAETCGHEFDFEMPNAHRYRDYVIRALNADVPYNQFVVEHIAGDLLPQPRRHPTEGYNESVIATGWYLFGEAVHSPVDVRQDEANRIDNQIDVFAKTFLGLTVSCARCHDHKFDAISTKDYYALAGYLQSSRYQQAFLDPPEQNAGIVAECQAIAAERGAAYATFARETLVPRLTGLSATLLTGNATGSGNAPLPIDQVLGPWDALVGKPPVDVNRAFDQHQRDLVATWKNQIASPAQWGKAVTDFNAGSFGSWRTTGDAFGSRPGRPLEWSFNEPGGRLPGRLLTKITAHSGLVSNKLRGTLRSPTFEITEPKIWYRLYGTGGQVRLVVDGLQLIQDPIYGGLKFDAGGPEPHWRAQDVTKWIGHRAYVELLDDGDGYLALEQVVQSSTEPPTAGPNRLLVGTLDDKALASPATLAAKYQATLEKVLNDWLASTEPESLPDLAEDRAAILAWIFGQQLLDLEGIRTAALAAQLSLSPLDEKRQKVEARITLPQQALAIADGTGENERVFIRGSHKSLGEEVPRRLLEALGGLEQPASGEGSGRLALAEQLVSPGNPLVARVIVNRLWHHHFGAGLVTTTDDFGVMGQRPTHPELLDYLAHDFMQQGWSLKQAHRQMVLSNTYQMASQPMPEADLADSQNKLWHRRTVRRLEAESIRDAVLAVSGRLDRSMYGPGVMPYLTEYMAGRGRPKDSGPLDGANRRSIYQAVRRNFLSPMFLAFDYPTPFTTIGRRGASNVPAQALAMMNNPFVGEQSRHWAESVAKVEASQEQRIQAMYETAFGRLPDAAETSAALAFVQDAATPEEKAQAWTDLAHVLFNLKEFIFIP